MDAALNTDAQYVTTGHFGPDYVVMPGGFQDIGVTPPEWLGNTTRDPQQESRGRGSIAVQNTSNMKVQEAIHNPEPIPSLKFS